METIVLVIHLLLAIALIGVVLLQKSEGGGLGIGGSGGGGGMSGFMTARGAADVLTRTTAILAACFMATSMILAIMAAHDREGAGGSILDQNTPQSTSPLPLGGERTTPAVPTAPTAN